ncbi:MAG: hypothetical protein ACYC3I_22175 [Gemmataceae bacterium]
MRSRLAVLMLLAVLPPMSVLAAPAPDPSAILDIGPPPKGETAEQYRKRLIQDQTGRISLCDWWSDPEVKKLPSVARFKDPRPWLAKNLRVKDEDDRRLRFTFRAGTRAEQVTILNALLRVNLSAHDGTIKWGEECIRNYEKAIREYEVRIKWARNTQEAAEYRKGIEEVRSIRVPELRAEIDSLKKQLAVIKWAK